MEISILVGKVWNPKNQNEDVVQYHSIQRTQSPSAIPV